MANGSPPAHGVPPANGFPPAARLHDQRDYGRVFGRQQKAAGPHAVVLVMPRRGRARLGVMVAVKTARLAVRRHQLKRWVRERFRCAWQHAHPGLDMVVLMHRDPPGLGHAQLIDELDRLLAKALTAAPGPRQAKRRRRR